VLIYLAKYNIPPPGGQTFLFPPLDPPTCFPYRFPLLAPPTRSPAGDPHLFAPGWGIFVYPFSIKSLACDGEVG